MRVLLIFLHKPAFNTVKAFFAALFKILLEFLASSGPIGAPKCTEVQTILHSDGVLGGLTHAQRRDHQKVSDGS